MLARKWWEKHSPLCPTSTQVDNTAGDSFDLYYGLFMYNTNATEEVTPCNPPQTTVVDSTVQCSTVLHCTVLGTLPASVVRMCHPTPPLLFIFPSSLGLLRSHSNLG